MTTAVLRSAVLPNDWPLAPLGDLFSFANGVNADKSAYGKGVPFINVLEVITHSHLRESYIPGQVLLSRSAREAFSVRRGDVLFNRTSETQDEVGLTSVYVDEVPVVFGGFVIRGRFITQALDQTYAGYALRAPTVRAQIISQGQGAIRANIGQANLKRVLIPIPPLPEQYAIAEALFDVDRLLGALNGLIAKKRAIKQGAMQQLLTGKTRLPGFSGEWTERTLWDLAEHKKELLDDGDWIEAEHITTQGIRFVQTGNIGIGKFIDRNERKYINSESFESLRCKCLTPGDLLVCRLADPAGRACLLPDIHEDRMVTSVDVTIFRPPPDVADRSFLSHMFCTSTWFKSVRDRSGGTTHKRIARSALGAISVSLPPLLEQHAIASILSDMDMEIAALETRRDKAQAIKQGMMQQLLTGRIRLVGPGAAA